jgi:filamentous hemagglutinin
MVSRAIETVGPDKVKTVSAQLGKDNLDAFRAGTAAGFSKEQAVWSTPLGKTMNALGFRNVDISGTSVKFLQ